MTGVLAVSNGTLNANNNLTLVSNEAGSAVIAPVAAGSSIIGKVTVQRYIAKVKSVSISYTSVTTDDFISNNWQLVHIIMGPTGSDDGFDETVSGNPSLYTYNNAQASGNRMGSCSQHQCYEFETQSKRIVFNCGDRDVDITTALLPDMNNPVIRNRYGNNWYVKFDRSTTPGVNNTTNCYCGL
jgi:hypothetical protein